MRILVAVCILICCVPVLSIGEEFKIPNEFKPGDDIKAEAFNQNFEAIENEINKLNKKTASIASPSIVHSKEWKLKKTESKRGGADWQNLPTPMALPIKTTGKANLIIMANISRAQQSKANVNTEYRIILEHKIYKDRLVAITGTGNHGGWAFDTVTFHGSAQDVESGEYTVSVQFKTRSDTTEHWFHNQDGYQYRRLTVLEVPKPVAK